MPKSKVSVSALCQGITRRRIDEITNNAEADISAGSSGQLPRSGPESIIESAMQEVFRIHGRLTTADNFFQLGGDSFSAIHLVAAIRKRGYGLSVGDIYSNPLLSAMATVTSPISDPAHLDIKAPPENLQKDHDCLQLRREAARICGISTTEIEYVYKASPFQENLAATLLRGSAGEGAKPYVATFRIGVSRLVDVDKLLRALEMVILRNPIFRTRLVHCSKGTFQVVCTGDSLVSAL